MKNKIILQIMTTVNKALLLATLEKHNRLQGEIVHQQEQYGTEIQRVVQEMKDTYEKLIANQQDQIVILKVLAEKQQQEIESLRARIKEIEAPTSNNAV